MVLGWFWGGFEVVLGGGGWFWGDIGLVSGWFLGGIVVVLGWFWEGLRVFVVVLMLVNKGLLMVVV